MGPRTRYHRSNVSEIYSDHILQNASQFHHQLPNIYPNNLIIPVDKRVIKDKCKELKLGEDFYGETSFNHKFSQETAKHMAVSFANSKGEAAPVELQQRILTYFFVSTNEEKATPLSRKPDGDKPSAIPIVYALPGGQITYFTPEQSSLTSTWGWESALPEANSHSLLRLDDLSLRWVPNLPSRSNTFDPRTTAFFHPVNSVSIPTTTSSTASSLA